MSHDDEHDTHRGFKVQDRRRFTDSGEVRPDQDEAAAPAPAAPQPAAPQPTTQQPAASAPEPPPAAEGTHAPPLEMNFSTFVISLSTQALAHLGEIAHPFDNQVTVDLAAAKHLIDILGILKTKTQGNLDASEAALLDGMLYDLRIKYVELTRGRS